MSTSMGYMRDPRDEDSYAIDRLGIRRLVKAGDGLWPGWVWEDVVESTVEPVEAEVEPAATKAPAPAHRKR